MQSLLHVLSGSDFHLGFVLLHLRQLLALSPLLHSPLHLHLLRAHRKRVAQHVSAEILLGALPFHLLALLLLLPLDGTLLVLFGPVVNCTLLRGQQSCLLRFFLLPTSLFLLHARIQSCLLPLEILHDASILLLLMMRPHLLVPDRTLVGHHQLVTAAKRLLATSDSGFLVAFRLLLNRMHHELSFLLPPLLIKHLLALALRHLVHEHVARLLCQPALPLPLLRLLARRLLCLHQLDGVPRLIVLFLLLLQLLLLL
mmetsp:Transcript_27589/g.88723  ORF Transcript_27589/g.88723 Transcript_27589/m.88723 type:complete len:256 (-) Transcript_27589:597-1364(-)